MWGRQSGDGGHGTKSTRTTRRDGESAAGDAADSRSGGGLHGIERSGGRRTRGVAHLTPGRTDETHGDDRPPVLAVKIDNASAARPQTGLESADVVYVEQVEGGLSRLMAVYATRLPESVGPVRSVREADLELLRQFDRPILAFSGAQGRLLPLIDRAPLEP